MSSVWSFLSDFLRSLAELWSWLVNTKFDFLGYEVSILTAISTSLLAILGAILIAKLVALVIPG